MQNRKNEIVIVPLGPDDGSLMTLGACEAVRKAGRVILRTERHGAVHLPVFEGISFETLDALYDQYEDFDDLCLAVSDYLIRQAQEGDLCYAVSDPLSDATVKKLIQSLPDSVQVRILGGVPLSANVLAAAAPLGGDFCTDNVHIYTAMALEGRRVQAEPQVICEINDRILASDVKLWLSDLYEDDTEVAFLENAGTESPEVRLIRLMDLDRQPGYDHRTAVFVPEIDVLKRKRAGYEDLVKVIAYLRSPDGCPWDRAQTHRTLRRYMIEEACEAADAMGTEDSEKIADELGDVLLQVVLNAQIGAEHRDFTDRDVTSAITRKMITRHEHVFGTARADTPDAVMDVWESAKKKEHGKQSTYERVKELPESLPTLLKTQKMLKRESQGTGKKLDTEAAREQILKILSASPLTETGLALCLKSLCVMAEAGGLDAESALREHLAVHLEQLKEGSTDSEARKEGDRDE